MIHFTIFFLVQIMILSFLGALHVGPHLATDLQFTIPVVLGPHVRPSWLSSAISELDAPRVLRQQLQGFYMDADDADDGDDTPRVLRQQLQGFNIFQSLLLALPLVLPHHLTRKNDI